MFVNEPGELSAATGAKPRRRALFFGVITAVAVAFAAAVFAGRGDGGPQTLGAADVNQLVDARVKKAVTDLQNQPARSALVYGAIAPSIVVIRTERPGTDGLGSGVIVADDGTILTAQHVIAGARSIRVGFADGTESAAELVNEDKSIDIAVLVPERLPEVVVPAVLGGGGRIGDEAYAVGHPLGFAGSMTAGVISGLDRTIPRRDGAGDLEGLIQFDAAVNPGSSGGPLLNRGGQVIGIVTALANPSKDGLFIGIAFAVPIGAAGGAAGAPAK